MKKLRIVRLVGVGKNGVYVEEWEGDIYFLKFFLVFELCECIIYL